MKSSKPKAGDIVLIPFPFTNLTSNKIRPALVISYLGDNITLLFITTSSPRSEYSLLLQADSGNGLKEQSYVITSKIATLDRKSIIGKLGELDSKTMILVKNKLKKYLEL